MFDLQHIPDNLDQLRALYRQELDANAAQVADATWREVRRGALDLPPDDALAVEYDWLQAQLHALAAREEQRGAEFKQTLDTLQKDNADLQQTVKQQAEQLDSLDTALQQARVREEQLSTDVETLKTAVAQLTEASARFEAYEQRLQELEQQVKVLEERIPPSAKRQWRA